MIMDVAAPNGRSQSEVVLLRRDNEKFVTKKSRWTGQCLESLTPLVLCSLLSLLLLSSLATEMEVDVLGKMYKWTPTIAFIFSLLAALFAVLSFSNVRRQRKMCLEGIVLQAEILSCERTSYNDGWGSRITFRFISPQGSEIVSHEDSPRQCQDLETVKFIRVLFLDGESYYAL